MALIKRGQTFVSQRSGAHCGCTSHAWKYAKDLVAEIDQRFSPILADKLYKVAAFLDPQHKLKWCKKNEAKCAEVKATVLELMQKVDLVTQTKSSHSDGPRCKKRPSLLDYSDDEDDDDNERCDMEVKGCETELQLYIDSQKSDDVLRFWESKKSVFPRLYAITRQIFSVPATTAGVERLFSIAGYILSCRRLSLIDRNFEDQVFAHCNSDLLANASRKRKPDAD